MKTACILGATGLVGTELLSQLLLNNDFESLLDRNRKEARLGESILLKLYLLYQ